MQPSVSFAPSTSAARSRLPTSSSSPTSLSSCTPTPCSTSHDVESRRAVGEAKKWGGILAGTRLFEESLRPNCPRSPLPQTKRLPPL
eukprot:CAMPEP_0179411014 /NCGR_PEP_ID=MMETSP0799-20121207/3660_1 /TAXON_ID=46947 /ORGANISM="Geminigera cryophila, Strain CCMP2564" /LENGTH=86 /DNA_ID=CAMNT_0021183033 /DNA_START=754 /DNA_END=1010 /DNA_ORIENTATION=-